VLCDFKKELSFVDYDQYVNFFKTLCFWASGDNFLLSLYSELLFINNRKSFIGESKKICELFGDKTNNCSVLTYPHPLPFLLVLLSIIATLHPSFHIPRTLPPTYTVKVN
jgi:hypothetical protein